MKNGGLAVWHGAVAFDGRVSALSAWRCPTRIRASIRPGFGNLEVIDGLEYRPKSVDVAVCLKVICVGLFGVFQELVIEQKPGPNRF